MLGLRVAQRWPAVYCSAPFPTSQPCCWLLLPVCCRSMAGSNITVAPEVFVEQPLRISARYDVFALGSMLFEALSGPYFAAREVLGRGWLASMRAVCSVLLTSWFCCHAWPPLPLVPCLPYPAVARSAGAQLCGCGPVPPAGGGCAASPDERPAAATPACSRAGTTATTMAGALAATGHAAAAWAGV